VFVRDLEHHACEFTGEADLSEVIRARNRTRALAYPMSVSWNQIATWLRKMDELGRAA
jgi:hypothetical protein